MATEKINGVRFSAEELPYAYEALAPHISEETMRFHHDKHYMGYVAKLNELVPGTAFENQSLEELVVTADGAIFNNAAQAWNHAFYFGALSPTPAAAPAGALAAAIERSFGSVEKCREEMTRAAIGLFGSGWVWLVADAEGNLSVRSESNAGTPLRQHIKPLLCIDVWEHAYYIDYRNRRADAVAAFWNVVDWRVVGERYDRK